MKCAVHATRLAFTSFDSVLMTAHTGVAAANMGGGASTVNSLFKITGDTEADDLEGDKLTDLCTKLQNVKLLVIDEVSMLSGLQLEMISRRLDQVMKTIHMRNFNNLNAFSSSGFGGISVMLVGDFGQLPLINGLSLISHRLSRQGTPTSRARTFAGQRRFRDFTDAIRLWRVYRQKSKDHF